MARGTKKAGITSAAKCLVPEPKKPPFDREQNGGQAHNEKPSVAHAYSGCPALASQ
jgi:hypothetical protein